MSYYRDISNQDARLPERSLDQPEPTEIQPDESDLRQAREELAERVSAGKRVGKIDLYACLENELDADSVVFLEDIATLLGSMYKDYGSGAAFWCRACAYVERIAARHIADDDVLDRAVQTLNERDADA